MPFAREIWLRHMKCLRVRVDLLYYQCGTIRRILITLIHTAKANMKRGTCQNAASWIRYRTRSMGPRFIVPVYETLDPFS